MRKRKAQKILDSAALLIETEGWTQGRYYDQATGAYCVTGAVIKVTGGDSQFSRWSNATASAMALLKERIGENPIIFNDERGRTKEQVLYALRGK